MMLVKIVCDFCHFRLYVYTY